MYKNFGLLANYRIVYFKGVTDMSRTPRKNQVLENWCSLYNDSWDQITATISKLPTPPEGKPRTRVPPNGNDGC